MSKLRIPIPKNHLFALGRITSEFAFIDLALNMSIWTMMKGAHSTGEIITSSLSYAQKRDLFRALYIQKYNPEEESISKLNDLIVRIQKAGEKRNTIVHSIWMTRANQPRFTISRINTSVRMRSGFQRKIDDMKAKDLLEIADSFKELANNIIYFMGLIDDEDR